MNQRFAHDNAKTRWFKKMYGGIQVPDRNVRVLAVGKINPVDEHGERFQSLTTEKNITLQADQSFTNWWGAELSAIDMFGGYK